MPKWIPTAPEVLREAIIVLAGAALAAVVVKFVVPDSAKSWFSLPSSGTQTPNY